MNKSDSNDNMSRYKLQKSTHQPDWWVLTDTENGIVCRFREHEYNETQKMTFLDDVERPDAPVIARLMSDMGDWLATHHYNIAMPPVAFCIQQTDDDSAQFLERGKYPRFRVIIDDECTAHELAVALHKASEYLHKKSGRGGLG